MNIVANLKKMFSRAPRAHELPIILDASGFSIESESVRWLEVVEVAAYKADLVTTDTVRIRITLKSGVSVELDEDQPGFSEFVASLEAQFPSVKGWRSKVLQPPFARNETLLYGRT